LRSLSLPVRPLARSLAVAAQNGRHAAGLDSKVCVILGSQWGDEGKGKLVDALAEHYQLVARFNGGSNAGHTVVSKGRKYALHQVPCGVIYDHTQNLIGNGCVVSLPALFNEIKEISNGGLDPTNRLFISDRAQLLFEHHKLADGALEAARGQAGQIGTTKQGIGPAYAAKMSRNNPRVGHLKHWATFEEMLRSSIAAHERMFGVEINAEAEVERYRGLAREVGPMIVDGVQMVNDAHRAGSRIMAEGANAAMLDIDFGTYPFVTSSSTTVGGVFTGLGLAPSKLECVLGVVKAYTTRVGGGPFPTELHDEVGEHLQTVGAEFGVTTGRKRRCGWLDIPLLRYTHQVNGYSSLNLTKLDVLSDLDEIKIGVEYEVDGTPLPHGVMPSTLEDLAKVQVRFETLPGWKCDISGARTMAELPAAAQQYVRRIEELLGCPVTWVGVGVDREAMAINF